MLSKLKDTAKDTILYGLGNVAAKALGFVLIPLYIKTLSLADFGILSLTEVIVQLLTPVMGMAIYSAMARWYWDKDYSCKQESIYKTSMFIVLILSSIIFIIGLLSAKYLSIILFNSIKYESLINLVLISSFIQANLNIPFTLLRLQKKALKYSILNLLKLILIFGFTIYLIVFNNYGIEGIYIAQIIGSIFIFILILYFIKENLIVKIDYSFIKPMLKYSYPLAISVTSAIILTISDRFSIRYIIGFEQTGIYALGFKISSVLKLVFITSFQMAFVPIIYQAANKEGFTRFLSKLNSYSVIVIIYASLAVGLFSKEITELITSDSNFTNNYIYLIIPILNLALVFDQIRYNISFGLNLAKKTKVLSGIIIIMSILNIILNIILINFIGSIGAAISTLFVQILYVIVIYKITNKYYKIDIEITNIIRITVLYLIFLLPLILLSDFTFINQIIIKALLIILFPIIAYFIWQKDKIEKQRVVEIIYKYLKLDFRKSIY